MLAMEMNKLTGLRFIWEVDLRGLDAFIEEVKIVRKWFKERSLSVCLEQLRTNYQDREECSDIDTLSARALRGLSREPQEAVSENPQTLLGGM